MRVQIFPEFLRQREQRVRGGVLTVTQMLVGVTILAPLAIATSANPWLCVPAVLLFYGALVFWALAPAEGGVRAMHAILGLQAAWLNRALENHHAFVGVEATETAVGALQVQDASGRVVLVAEIDAPEL